MERLGVLGGTFNPVHNGHIRLAAAFRDRLGLDRVLLVPVNAPPHKHGEMMQSGADRLAMCRLAAAGEPGLEASDIELCRGGTSYTVDTLRALHARYPAARLYFLMGADMFLTLEQWRNFPAIAGLAVLCTLPRHPDESGMLRGYARLLARRYGARCVVEDIPPVELSSTGVREQLRERGRAPESLPPAVAEYIRKRGLYRSGTGEPGKEMAMTGRTQPGSMNEERFLGILKGKLTEKRFYHSRMVSEKAVQLAARSGGDVEKARFAGLVHDIEKDTPGPEQLQILAKYSIILDNVERVTPKLWHAMAGAAVLEHEYGVADPDVLAAVRYHTTARAGMSLLEKIIYLADYISADRDYEGVGQLRQTVGTSLEDGLRAALDFSITELVDKGAPIHLDTVRARNELLCGPQSGEPAV